MTEILEKVCEKHNVKYTAKRLNFLGGEYISKCPICEAELKAQRERDEKAMLEAKLAENRQRDLEIKRAILRDSGIPKRYESFKPTDTENFAKYKGFLASELKENLFIFGSVGQGKTLFCCELIKANLNLKPIYLCGSDLALIQKNDFNLMKYIDKLKGYDLIVIDEISFLLENAFVLDLIVDCAYRDDKRLVLCGNISFNEFADKAGQRVISRVSQGLKILKFTGKDLRI